MKEDYLDIMCSIHCAMLTVHSYNNAIVPFDTFNRSNKGKVKEHIEPFIFFRLHISRCDISSQNQDI